MRCNWDLLQNRFKNLEAGQLIFGTTPQITLADGELKNLGGLRSSAMGQR